MNIISILSIIQIAAFGFIIRPNIFLEFKHATLVDIIVATAERTIDIPF